MIKTNNFILGLFFFSNTCYSQTAPNGFWDIPFGTPYDQVYQIMTMKSGYIKVYNNIIENLNR